jgi:hypothetical protein
MAGFRERLVGFATGLDGAFNALGGGLWRETISGTIGRGLEARAWWAEPARRVVDGVFGEGHCAAQAAKEARRRGS